jgi:hypothetical protein
MILLTAMGILFFILIVGKLIMESSSTIFKYKDNGVTRIFDLDLDFDALLLTFPLHPPRHLVCFASYILPPILFPI